MPFRKVGNRFVGPSGRKFSLRQVKLYKALGNAFPKTRKGTKLRKKK
jgi:hypothetical protein